MDAGDSSHQPFSALLTCRENGLEVGAGRRQQEEKVVKKRKRDAGVVGWTSCMGRAQLDPYKRRVGRKVKALQKLVPNGQSVGADGLFKETADYIHCLQMQVKIMQVVLKVLNDGST